MVPQNLRKDHHQNDYQLGRTAAWCLVLAVLLVLGYLVFTEPGRGGQDSPDGPGIRLGEPPLFPDPSGPAGLPQPVGGSITGSPALDSPGSQLPNLDKLYYFPIISHETGLMAVNPAIRQASLDFYRKYYLTSSVNPGWTGNIAACNPGTTTQAFRDSVLERINYFRAMAGVPAGVTFSDEYNQKAQQAALMMSANASLSHDPPTSWKCYTDQGHEAAGKSNLAMGDYGRGALKMYMQDSGSGNSVVGHRRWILYPQTQNMGTGDIPGGGGYWAANDLWVFDSHMWEPRPATREAYVAWPPPGYVPYPIVFPRWSFSYAAANFDNAAVSMTENGANIPLTRYAPGYGYGENTLVWIRTGMNEGSDWPRPAADTTYVVTVSNVLIGGSPRSFQYTVIVFDPG